MIYKLINSVAPISPAEPEENSRITSQDLANLKIMVQRNKYNPSLIVSLCQFDELKSSLMRGYVEGSRLQK